MCNKMRLKRNIFLERNISRHAFRVLNESRDFIRRRFMILIHFARSKAPGYPRLQRHCCLSHSRSRDVSSIEIKTHVAVCGAVRTDTSHFGNRSCNGSVITNFNPRKVPRLLSRPDAPVIRCARTHARRKFARYFFRRLFPTGLLTLRSRRGC